MSMHEGWNLYNRYLLIYSPQKLMFAQQKDLIVALQPKSRFALDVLPGCTDLLLLLRWFDSQVLFHDVAALTQKLFPIVEAMQKHFSYGSGAYYSDAIFFLSVAMHRIMPQGTEIFTLFVSFVSFLSFFFIWKSLTRSQKSVFLKCGWSGCFLGPGFPWTQQDEVERTGG